MALRSRQVTMGKENVELPFCTVMSPGSRPSPPSPPVFQITAPRNEVSRPLHSMALAAITSTTPTMTGSFPRSFMRGLAGHCIES